MKKKVLVVDDADYFLKLMRTVLEDLNYEVATAQDGSEALKVCDEFRPDFVLLDIVMPDVNGFELCRTIKGKKNSDIKIIIYTGHVDAINNREVRESGADGFAFKTEALEEIIQEIDEVFQ